MPGNKHWAQCQFSSGFSCVSLSVEFLPVHIQRRLWSSLCCEQQHTQNRSPVPTAILCIWSHMFWIDKTVIWVRVSPFNNEKTHGTTQCLKSRSQTFLQVMWVQHWFWQGQHTNIQSHGIHLVKILEHTCSSLSSDMAVWAHSQRFVAFLTWPGWVKVASRCPAVTASEHSANTPQGVFGKCSLNQPGFFSFPFFIFLSDFFLSNIYALTNVLLQSLFVAFKTLTEQQPE